MKTKLSKLLLAVATVAFASALAVPALAMADEAAGSSFADVEGTEWFAADVEWANESGLMTGTGDGTNFEPSLGTTRAMFVTSLHRLEGEPAPEAADARVPGGKWYTDAANWALEAGVLKGYDDGELGLSDVLTREQAAVFAYRYAEHKGFDLSEGEDTNILSYLDADRFGSWAIPAVQWACGEGIILGYTGADGELTGYWGPKDEAARSMAAAILHRLVDNVVIPSTEEEEEPSAPSAPSVPSTPSHQHDYGDWKDNGNGTHSKSCECGDDGSVVTEDCDLSGDLVTGNNGKHYVSCPTCGYVKAYDCTYGEDPTQGEDGLTHSYSCECGYARVEGCIFNADKDYVCACGNENAPAAIVDPEQGGESIPVKATVGGVSYPDAATALANAGSGGTVVLYDDVDQALAVNRPITINANGNSIKMPVPASSDADITINGTADATVDVGSSATNLNGADVTFNGVTLKGSNGTYVGLQHAGDIVYNNVVFDEGIFLYGTSETFNNCTFNLTSQYIWTYGAGTATFNNCTFNTQGKVLLFYVEGTDDTKVLNVNDCTFNATQPGYAYGVEGACAAVEIDSSLPSGGTGSFILNLSGSNVVDEDFGGLYRIKKGGDKNNVTVNVVEESGNAVGANDLAEAVAAGATTVILYDEYTISEKLGADVNVVYDPSVYEVTYTVTKDTTGTAFEVSEPAVTKNGVAHTGEILFSNKDRADASLVISGIKTFNGVAPSAGAFEFVLKDDQGNEIGKVTNDATGAFTFDELKFHEIEPSLSTEHHQFTITEVAGTMGGVIYDSTVYKLYVSIGVIPDIDSFIVDATVTKVNANGTESLVIDREGSHITIGTQDGIAFSNYTWVPPAPADPEVSVTLSATKTLDGKAPGSQAFAFQLKDADGNVVATASSNASGAISFGNLTFDAPGTYKYTISEVAGSDEGFEYDSSVFGVTVTVTEDATGELSASVAYSSTPAFANKTKYEPVEVALSATKTLDGKAPGSNAFLFTLSKDGTVVEKATNSASGAVSFGALSFDTEGVYKYVLSEVAGSDEGFEYDASTYEITVTVTRGEDNKLEAATSITKDGKAYSGTPAFANKTVEEEEKPDPELPDTGNDPKPDGPIAPTGDGSPILPLVVLIMAAAAGIAIALRMARRRA